MKYIKLIVFVLVVSSVGVIYPVFAGNYSVSKLTHVFTDVNGMIAMKWDGAPDPGPCGTNYGWVILEAGADKALKTFVYTLYVSEKPVTVVTSGCTGTREIVTGIYSPGG